ncbi:type 1 glutamine amidotransferase [Serinicoccus kebangsaanensis]|uniref:type 1 glutamine amidotransferase n=1 Tax=Serinicoccus kebangsaanensis TaxID=2602069 RepID=UPI00124C870D|nr:type 1 glutamine amidotransferase [Serinicoccus kebangsaanensis]
MSPRVLVLQHEDKAPPGLLLPWLERAGIGCDVLPAHEGYAVPAALTEHAGLVVLGGSMAATDDALHRWLLPTRALIAATVSAGSPFLGICLGHQLATVALGGEVGPHPGGRTRGLFRWSPTEAGREDELTQVLADTDELLHWNRDVVTRLPASAQPLAHAPDGTVQAARFGPRAWGVQFHPEVDADLVVGWTEGTEPEAELRALHDLRARQDLLHPAWERLLRRFAVLATAPEALPA